MNRISRRTFLRDAARASTLLAAGSGGAFLTGCAAKRAPDLLIRGALVYDGSGGAPFSADVAIAGDRIVSVGKLGARAAARAARVVDAGGLALAPGFVDIHEHTATFLLVNPRAESSVRQGITTVISGQCGDSPFPLSARMAAEMAGPLKEEDGIDLTWRDIGGFFARIEQAGTAVNYASYVGQGTIREAVMGPSNRAPSNDDLEAMRRLLRESMAGGALGLSSGLEYTPGCWATTEEIVEVLKAAAPRGGLYSTHIRDEENGVVDAVAEAIRIAREAGVKLQIAHLKVGYPENWPKFDQVIGLIDEAAASGLDLRCDRYPYTAWSTGLIQFFPLWSREGTNNDVVARLSDRSLQPRLRAEVEETGRRLGSWDRALIASVPGEANRRYEGMDVLAASTSTKKDPYTFLRDLMVQERTRGSAITFAMDEGQLKRTLAHPLVGVGSDGGALAPYGRLARGKPHPRHFGTFPRLLGKYVREEKVATLQEMVRKITSMPADRLGLDGRGRVREGAFADLVLFDPARVADRATWTEPMLYPVGIEMVVVNGSVVVDRGEHTGRLPGRVLRKNERGMVL